MRTTCDRCGDGGRTELRNDGGDRTADTRGELTREIGLEEEGSGVVGERKTGSEEEPVEFVRLGGSTPVGSVVGESTVMFRWDLEREGETF